jgi:hypothetical protein
MTRRKSAAGTTGTVRTAGGLSKPASRLTLEDLFGPGPLPAPDQIQAVAKAEARKSAARRAEAKDPEAAANREARLAAIKAAAEATGLASPEWARVWHATARVLVVCEQTCACGAQAQYNANGGWLVEYTNSKTDSSHLLDPAGPIDRRLPAKKKILRQSVSVCPSCFTEQTQEAPSAEESPK